MNTDEGASMWNQYIGPLANQGYTILGSPSTTSNPNGLEWIKDWITKISVQPTHICVHYYDISADDFKQYMTKFYNTAGIDPGGIDHGKKPLMVTEYACQNFNDINNQCSSDQVWSFVKDTTSWMDQTEWIVAYAPFGAFYLSPQPPPSTDIYVSPVPRLHARHARRQHRQPAHEQHPVR